MTPEQKLTWEAVVHAGDAYPPEALPTIALNVKRCVVEATAAAVRADAEGASAAERRSHAAAAYKLNLPVMTDKPSVQAYIACIAEGMSLRFINGSDGSKLLYAAQIALSLLKDQKRERKPATRRSAPRSLKARAA